MYLNKTSCDERRRVETKFNFDLGERSLTKLFKGPV